MGNPLVQLEIRRIWKLNSSGNSEPTNLYEFNSKVYFSATDGSGEELWSSDGTVVGTTLVKSLCGCGSFYGPSDFFEWNGSLYFQGYTTAKGIELWKT